MRALSDDSEPPAQRPIAGPEAYRALKTPLPGLARAASAVGHECREKIWRDMTSPGDSGIFQASRCRRHMSARRVGGVQVSFCHRPGSRRHGGRGVVFSAPFAMIPDDRTSVIQNWIDRLGTGDEVARGALLGCAGHRLTLLARRMLR